MTKKILIIDDDPDFVEMNKSVLEAGGYNVIFAHKPKDGIKLIESEKPDLILLDVMMGSDVAGFDAVETIRELPGGTRIPIIMITSFAEHHETPWEGKPDQSWVNVQNYLQKPVTPEKLLEEVAKLIK